MVGSSQVTEGGAGLAGKGVNRRKVLSVRQEPRNRMLVGEAEELIGMRPWRAQRALVRGLDISGNEDL